jgi:septal ring factor EnvC (AmiA/AmiB activator)
MIVLLLLVVLAAPAGNVQDSGDAIRELKQEERVLLDDLDRVIDERKAIERRARAVSQDLAELTQTLTAETEQLAVEEKAVARALADARARLRQLDRMLRGQAVRFVIGAESFADGLRRGRVVERAFRRDAQMVARASRVLEAREQKAKELGKKHGEVQTMLAAMEDVKRQASASSFELQATLLLVRQKRSLEERAFYDLREFEATLQRESEEDAIAAQDPFVRQRGRLGLPMDRRFRALGDDGRVLRFTHPGGEVRAVAAGVVEHVGPLEGYDTVVIVKHSKNYYGVYSGLAQAAVKMAEAVAAGAHIGSAAQSGLRFELRRRTVVEEAGKWFAE